MPYQINGTDFLLPPESGAWKSRDILGLDGNGHAVYPPTREFEIQWSFMALSELDQLHGFYASMGITGSVVVTLPQWNKDPYTYLAYTGCAIQEPTFDVYDNYYITNVHLMITNIRT